MDPDFPESYELEFDEWFLEMDLTFRRAVREAITTEIDWAGGLADAPSPSVADLITARAGRC